MSNIHIITASAGSGKTYRLTQLLENKITSREVRPEAVMATTFTRKAATELQERVRQRLISNGHTNEANRLAVAHLNTINAICGALVTEFAFLKGLSPKVGVLDENAAERELRRSISKVATQEQTQRLAELETLLNGIEWIKAVKQIITLARSNGLDGASLAASKASSEAHVKTLFTSHRRDERELDRQLHEALEAFVSNTEIQNDTTQKTINALDTARKNLNRLDRGQQLPWSEWYKLSKLEPAKKLSKHTAPLLEAAGEHTHHPRLQKDILDAVRLVFDIAIGTLEAYQEHKRLWGFIDFADQESLTVELLEKPEVIAYLQDRLDLLLVDEFQDTSPMQLAILLKLAELSEETVWVGDQKQSIYGFRGTDPALMDACLDTLLNPGTQNKLETLDQSWRSRPPLVDLTSDVFSQAFQQHGIPEEQVRLRPALEELPEMGPAVEWWNLQPKNKSLEAHALTLAQGVAELLADPDVRVRDRQSQIGRAVRPGDVGLLCRTNKMCRQVADALASVNIRAVLPSSGLLDTPEVQAMLAGLRLWVDRKDVLAAAELARMLHYPEQPDEWLQAVLEHPGAEAFADLPEVSTIVHTAVENPTAGVEQSLTQVGQILRIREWCLAWGASEERLANLDALQAQAMEYIDACFQGGVGCTPAGFISWLYELQRNCEDERNPVGGEDAVQVTTWHRSKGLEWPVTVLAQLGNQYDPNPFGVRVVSDWERFEPRDPLAERRLQYLASPYDPRTKKSALHDRIREQNSYQEIARQHDRQELRLLYVGWTRARDRLVLAGSSKEFSEGLLQMLKDEQKNWLLAPPQENEATWAGRRVSIQSRDVEPAVPQPRDMQPGADYSAQGPREHPPARAVPSQMSASTDGVITAQRIGSRLTLHGEPDINALGEALHTFYAADRMEFTNSYRQDLAGTILHRWGCTVWLKPEEVVQSADVLYTWIQENYPQAVWKREKPISQRLENGTEVFGFIDLLLETPSESIIIDHKAFPGSLEEAKAKAMEYVGQLQAYQRGLNVMGFPAVTSYIHYPVGGCMLSV